MKIRKAKTQTKITRPFLLFVGLWFVSNLQAVPSYILLSDDFDRIFSAPKLFVNNQEFNLGCAIQANSKIGFVCSQYPIRIIYRWEVS